MFNKFNYYKFQLNNGRWLNFQFKDEEELIEALNKYIPKNIYKSVARWMNPLKVETYKEHKLRAGFISSEILIEIDTPDNMEEGLKTINKIERFIKKNKLRDLIIEKKICSGGGYYLIIELKNHPADRTKRFKYTQNKRVLLMNALKKKGFPIDYPVCIDPFRVRRVEGTWNGKRQAWCRDMKTQFIYPYTPLTPTPAMMPLQADDTPLEEGFFPTKNKGVKPKAGKASPCFLIRSSIDGTKRAVPYFYFKKLSNTIKKKILRVQEIYGLSTLYVFSGNNGYHILGLDAIPKERLNKIYNAIKPSNNHEFNHFKNCGIVYAKKEEGRIISDWKLHLILLRKGAYKEISKPHKEFVSKMTNGIVFHHQEMQIGKTKNKVYKRVKIDE